MLRLRVAKSSHRLAASPLPFSPSLHPHLASVPSTVQHISDLCGDARGESSQSNRANGLCILSYTCTCIHTCMYIHVYVYLCIYFLYRVVFFLDAKVGKLFQFLLSHFMIAAVAAAFYLTNFPGKFTGIFGFVLFGFCVLLLLLLLLFLLLGCCCCRVHGALWFISPVS